MNISARIPPLVAFCILLTGGTSLTACAGTLGRPSAGPSARRDALLVLTGFGYGRAGERTLRSLEPVIAADGVDLYVPPYLSRGGLASSRARLQRFIQEQHLDRYERLHVFAFLAGGWTVNPLLDPPPANLITIVYDRSPLQERAPAIATDRLRLFAWLLYGSTIFDVARTAYPPLTAPNVNVALLVESVPTAFLRRHEAAARAMGPITFDCSSFVQPHADCGYVALSHDELYVHFDDVWPELRSFIRTSRFSSNMTRTPPSGDPFARRASR